MTSTVTDWTDKFITYEGRLTDGTKQYIAWAKDCSVEIGVYETYDEAVLAILEYTKQLNDNFGT